MRSALTPEQGKLVTHVHNQHPQNRNNHTKLTAKELNGEITLNRALVSVSPCLDMSKR